MKSVTSKAKRSTTMKQPWTSPVMLRRSNEYLRALRARTSPATADQDSDGEGNAGESGVLSNEGNRHRRVFPIWQKLACCWLMLFLLGIEINSATPFLQFDSTYLGDGWFQYRL